MQQIHTSKEKIGSEKRGTSRLCRHFVQFDDPNTPSSAKSIIFLSFLRRLNASLITTFFKRFMECLRLLDIAGIRSGQIK